MPPVPPNNALEHAELALAPSEDDTVSNETLSPFPPTPRSPSPPLVSNRRDDGFCGTYLSDLRHLRRRKKAREEVGTGDDAQTLAEETVLSRDAERVKTDLLLEEGSGGRLSGLTERRRERPVQAEQPRLLNSLGVASCSWMSALPDSAMLDELYIPGSHETLALHYPLLSSLCQTLPLTSQLTLGIRFLDLRFNLTQKGELWAYHGLVPQRRRAEEVFGEVYSWLEGWEGRQETVIVSIKQENDTPPDLFASVLISLIRSTTPLPSSPSNRTPESLWYTQKEWPQLGDVRGKAVLFCRFAWKGYGLHPVRWLNDQHVAWTTEIGGRDSLVQDWYGVRTPLSLPLKASLCLSLFDPASSSLLPSPTAKASRIPHRISFLSCATFPTLYPSTAAKGWGLTLRWPWSRRRSDSPKLGWKGVNELVLNGLEALDDREEEKPGMRSGRGWGRRRQDGQGGMCVLIDFVEFPGAMRVREGEERRGELVERVVECNFR